LGLPRYIISRRKLLMMTDRKTNKLERWLPKKKYLKLLSLRKTCPLTFNERLVFSLLVYASRRKRVAGLSQRAASRLLQLDKDTVPAVVADLIRHGLAERAGGLVHAKEPAGDRVNWFVHLNRPGCARWQDQYAYLLVALAAPLQQRPGRRRLKLSPRQIALYCLLINREKDGQAELSTASMAGLLGVDVRTVRSALRTLEECGLVEPHPKARTIQVFRPSAEQLDWFQARKEQPKKTPLYDAEEDKPWEGMTDQEIHEWVSDPTVSEYVRLLRHIRYCGRYGTPEMEAVRKKAELVLFAAGDAHVVSRLYHQAEKEHREAQRQGKFLGRNSYHLLNYKLDKYLDGRGARNPGAG
jgi:DNA-binding MarR family transcriptional regulator